MHKYFSVVSKEEKRKGSSVSNAKDWGWHEGDKQIFHSASVWTTFIQAELLEIGRTPSFPTV